jgi:exonuclease III
MAQDLTLSNDIIALQEHWLCDSNMHKLGMCNENYMFHGVSSMNERLSAGLLRGRPFCGVAFLWKKSIDNKIKLLRGTEDGNCLAILLCSGSQPTVIINVYFPCYANTPEYRSTVNRYIGFIESVVVEFSDVNSNVVVVGDFNFSCTPDNVGFQAMSGLMKDFNLVCCDELSGNMDTYYNASLGHSSCIDHVIVNAALRASIVAITVVDSVINHSDHRPITCQFKFVSDRSAADTSAPVKGSGPRYATRWDKANLSDYYKVSYDYLQQIRVDECSNSCSMGCDCLNHKVAIDSMYARIRCALQQAELYTVPHIPVQGLKPFWNDYLSELKEKSIFWGNLWKNAGKPKFGHVFSIKTACSLKYKNAIKHALYEYEHKFDDALYDHFARKEPTEFWKCWSRKFYRNKMGNTPNKINGVSDDASIANEFMKHFGSVYFDSSLDDVAKAEYLNVSEDNQSSRNQETNIELVNVELIDKCIRGLKLGKASGPDGLCTESLVNAHPKLVVLLSALFRSIILHNYVPVEFGQGIIVPLIKDRTGDSSSLNNYRAITLIPVLSKLFECIILDVCDEYLSSDDRQFGFKKDLGCGNAIFAVRSTMDYFNDRGSTVFTAALDVSKAYDCVQHFKLFTALLRVGMPRNIVWLLADWYSKLYVAVRWNDTYSTLFKVGSGVRQGSSLSPALFNVFINKVIIDLKVLELGCFVNKTWIGCVLYADDIILLSASLTSLQAMLNRVCTTFIYLKLSINANKSTCVAFGPHYKRDFPVMAFGSQVLTWSKSMKYLGVNLISGPHSICDTDHISRKFYCASNCVFTYSSSLTELMQLYLQTSFCLPVLQYVFGALRLNQTQVKSLNVCWNSVFRKIFKFNRWEPVSSFINGLGYLNFTHMYYLGVFKFIIGMVNSTHRVLNRLVSVYIRGNTFCQLLALFDVNVNMPLYVIKQRVSQRYGELSTK